MFKVNPYLSFNGNTEEAFDFYRSVFGGELQGPMRWGDNPECSAFSEADKNKVMHISLPFGDGNSLMGSDHIDGGPQKFAQGNNYMIAVHPDSLAECRRLFDGLSAGGTVFMPLSPAFWGAVFGCFVDKFGVSWMIESEAATKEWTEET